jgi:hypothetical protein
MRLLSKSLILLLLFILVIPSLSLVKPTNAQSIPKPSVPVFSLKYSDTFNNIPPITTSTTNPYNGNITTTTIPEQHIENKAINITIKNQPLPLTINGYTTNLYYNIRTKPHFGDFWATQSFTYFPMNDTSGTVPAGYFYLWSQSSSENTTIQYSVTRLQVGDMIDVQVEAILGYNYTTLVGIGPVAVNQSLFTYQTSGWSNTQTVTIENTVSTSPTPTVPELSWLAIIPLMVSILSIAVVLRHRKTAYLKQ